MDCVRLLNRCHQLVNRMPVKQRDARRIDLSTMADETCRELLVRFEAAGLDVAVWETTTDLSVPAFQCIATDRTEEIPHIAYGAGCHPTREVALLRALTEAAQVRMTYIVGSREDIRYSDYQPQSLKQKFFAARRLMQSGAVRVTSPLYRPTSFRRFEKKSTGYWIACEASGWNKSPLSI